MEIVNPFSVCNVPGYSPFSPMKWGMLEGSASSGSLGVLFLYRSTYRRAGLGSGVFLISESGSFWIIQLATLHPRSGFSAPSQHSDSPGSECAHKTNLHKVQNNLCLLSKSIYYMKSH